MLLLHEAPGSLRGPLWSAFLFATALAITGLEASVTNAQLKVYYDPLTGNVALDTTNTRSGELNNYFFSVNDEYEFYSTNPPAPFRHENLIRLSQSPLFTQTPTSIGDSTSTEPWKGLYTIGDVLPVGLSAQFWYSSFVYSTTGSTLKRKAQYTYGYNDVIGGGTAPAASLIYGRPEGEFDNKWDLVDPDMLNWATSATLIYRDWNGEVLIDTTGPESGYITNFVLKSAGKFRPDEFTGISNSALREASASTVFQANDAVEPGVYSLGLILEAGLSPEQFANIFTETKFMAQTGFNGASFDFATHGVAMTLQFVPEPSAVLLLALGTPLLAWGRKRSGADR